MATFGTSTQTTVDLGLATLMGTFHFVADAPAYTFSGGGLVLDGVGIVNDSGNTPTFNVPRVTLNDGTLGVSNWNVYLMFVTETASLGSANIAVTGELHGIAGTFGASTITLNGGKITYAGGGTTTGASATVISNGGRIDLAGFAGAGTALGSLAGTGTVDLGDKRLTLGGTGASTTYSGAISGTGSFVKEGAGTMMLSGVNSYSGATTISAGRLQAGAVNTLSESSAHTVAAGATLDLNGFNQTIGSLAGAGSVTLGSAILTTGGNNTSTTFSGSITGTGGLTKEGTGTMTLSGANSYSGATTVNAGTLKAGAANRFSSSSAHTVAAGATLDLNGFTQTIGSLAGAGNVTSSSTAYLVTGGNNTSTTFSGVISGKSIISKIGTGTMTLTGDSDYAGTQVRSGTLAVDGGSVTGTMVVGLDAGDNGMLHVLGGGSVKNENSYIGYQALSSGTARVTSGTWQSTSTLYVGYSGTGLLQVDGGLVSSGTGYLGRDSGSGGTAMVTGGTWQSSSTLYVGYSGTGSLQVDGGLVSSGAGYIGRNSGGIGTATVTGGTWQNTGGLYVGYNGSGGLTVGGSGWVTAASVTVADSGGSTGTLTLDGGVLETRVVSEGSGIGTMTFNGGTLRATNNNGAFINGFEPGDLTINAGGAFIDSNGFGIRILNSLSGVGGLTKLGEGTLTLGVASTYTGATTVSAGTLRAGAIDMIASSSGLTLASGAVFDLNGFNQTIGSLAGAGSVTLGSATLTTGGNNSSTTFSGSITGTGGLTKEGTGTMTLSGANSYSGATTVNAGTLKAGAANRFSSSSAHTVAAGATLDLNGFSQTIGSLAGAGNVTLGPAAILTTGGDNTSTTFSGVISGDGFVSKTGTGTMTLTGDNTYVRGTQVRNGTLAVDGGSVTHTDGSMVVGYGAGDNGVLHILGGGVVKGENGHIGFQASSNGTATVTSGTWESSSFLYVGYSGTGLLQVDGGLVSSRTGYIGANTGTNGTATVTSGTWQSALSLNVGFSGTGLLQVDGGLVSNGFGYMGVNPGSNGTAAVTSGTWQNFNDLYVGRLGTGVLTVSGSGRVTAPSVIVAAFDGSTGTLTLEGGALETRGVAEGTGTGSMTFNGGTLRATASNATFISGFEAGDLTIGAGGAVIDSNGFDIGIANSLSGAGDLTKLGAGTLTLGGANTYAGLTTINAGTLKAGASDVIASSSGLTLANAAGVAFDLNGFNQSIGTLSGGGALGGNIALGSATLTINQASDALYAGAISGQGALDKKGNATLVLTGANSYSGGTTVSGGILQGNTTSLQGNIVNNAAIVFDQATNGTYAGALSGNGSMTKQGLGALTLSGNNSGFTGSTTVAAGKLLVSGTLGGGVTVASSATLGGSGTIGGNARVEGTLSAGNSPGTLGFLGDLTLASGSTSLFELGTPNVAGGPTNDLVTVAGALSVAGRLEARVAAAGYYELYGYGTLAPGSAFDSTDVAGTGGFNVVKSAVGYGGGTASAVTLAVLGAGQQMQFWDGSNLTGNGTVNGGSGTWNAASSNWTGAPGSAALNGPWLGSVGVFMGTAGTVTVDGTQAIDTLQFKSDGYVLTGGMLALQPAAGGKGTFSVDGGVTATIGSVIKDGSAAAGLSKIGAGKLVLTGINTYSGGTTISGGTLQVSADANLGAASGGVTLDGGTLATTSSFDTARAVSLTANGGSIDVASGTTLCMSGALSGRGGLIKGNAGTLILTGTSSYSGGTTVSGGILQGNTTNLKRAITNNATVVFDQATNGTYAGIMSGTGGLTKNGAGKVTLSGANTYSGGTTVNGGILQGNTTSLQGNIVNNAALVFDQATDGIYAGTMSGSGSMTKKGAGLLALTGNNTYTGATTVSGGTLAINGSFAGSFTVGAGGTLGGTGTIGATTINAGGTIGPGNWVGTLTVNGPFVQTGGSTYQVEVNAAGQGDRINVVGASGTATINGGTVQVLAQAGAYARNTSYTILNATGGVSGAYAGVTSNFAFLAPSLSYDANNVYLLLFQTSSAFAAGAQTGNQVAVGTALDRANLSATGDFNTVLNALSSLNTQQGPAALNAISGQQYSGFGTANVSGGLMFMNVVGQQMSLARGGSGAGTRVALAEACDVACDAFGGSASPWSLWASALGGTGSIAGNNNSATLTYNAGGFAAGVDYRFSPNLLAGIGLGFSSGNQWANGLSGRGTADAYSASLYASFTQAAFYLDALAGYAYNDNQMTRQIVIPGLAPRNATGRTGANQFLGQAEAGYKVAIYEPAAASLTPFARFQAMSVSQNAFSESGASSLNLNVAQQTTSSVRTVLGAELAGAIDMGWRDRLALQFRLGWAHEYADTSRPVTASFAGAPTIGYTVYGAVPQRDMATIGLAANTAIAQGAQVYLRYDGEFGSGTDNHALSAGVRMSW